MGTICEASGAHQLSTHGAEMSCLALYFLSLEIRAFFAVDVLYSSL